MLWRWPVRIGLALLCICAAGCRQDRATDRSPDDSARSVRDDLGREVAIPERISRIVSLAPGCTEILFAVGAEDQIVGVTTFDNYPPAASEKEKVGGFARETISLEKIVQLRPDLVFSSGSLQRELIADLEKLGLAVFALEPDSYDGVVRAVESVGTMVGRDAQAAKVAGDMRLVLQKVKQKIATLSADQRPRVFYQVWDKPLRSAGPNSFIGHMVELAGGQNVLEDSNDAYPLVSEEAVIELDPEVILGAEQQKVGLESFASRPAWRNVSAVRDQRVFAIDEDVISRPGPRVSQALQILATKLHPELFAELPEATESSP